MDRVRDPSSKESMRSPLVDVSGLPLTVVMEMDESVLGNALRRLREETQNAAEIVAGHGASIP